MSKITAVGPVRAIAHRGEPVGHRENTLPSLRAALELGADLIEIDVKITADDQVVLLHDDTLDRLWGATASVREIDYADLQRIGPGQDLRIPLLSGGLALLSGTSTGLLIDMDAAEWAEPSLRVVNTLIKEGRIEREQIVWCGRIEPLVIIRELDPAARIFLSWDEGNADGQPPPDEAVRTLAPEVYNPHHPMVTPEVINWAAERGMATGCWTVDEESRMHELLDLGVKSIITNQIGTLRKVLDARA